MPETAPNLTAGAVPPAQATTTQAPVPPQAKTALPTEQKGGDGPQPTEKVKLKINGQEEEVSLEDLKKEAQKFKSADRLFQEARRKEQELLRERAELAEIRKQKEAEESLSPQEMMKRIVEKFQSDPQKYQAFRQSIEEHLVEQLKMEQASPEAQQLAQEKRRAEMLEKQLKEIKENEQKAKMEAMTNEQRQLLQKKLIDAAELAGLPGTEWNLRSMAEIMQKGLRAGYDLTPQQIAEFVRQDRVDNIQALGGTIAKAVKEAATSKDEQKVLQLGEQLNSVFGKDILDALRLVDLAKIRSNRAPVPQPTIETPKVQETEKKSHYLSWEEAEAERKKTIAQLEQEWRSGRKIG